MKRRLMAPLFGVALLGACDRVVGDFDRAAEGGGSPRSGAGATSDAAPPADAMHADAGAMATEVHVGPGAFSYNSAACAECMGPCEEAAVACYADSACRRLFECLFAVELDEPRQRGDCYEVDDSSASAWGLNECWRSQCRDQCLGTGGYGVMPFGPEQSSACQECSREQSCVRSNDGRNCASNGCESIEACRSFDSPNAVMQCVDRIFGSDDGCATGGGSAVTYGGGSSFVCQTKSCPTHCELGSQWGCLGEYEWASPRPRAIERRWAFWDFATGGIGGMRVRACQANEGLCDSPVVVTDENGNACLTLDLSENGFAGHFVLEHDDYYPSLLFHGAPITTRFAVETDVLANQALQEGNLNREGVVVDPDLGSVVVFAYDCTYTSAPSVSFELKHPNGEAADTGVRWYWVDSSGHRADATYDRTDTDGAGGFANVAPGRYVVQAKLADTGELVGCHEFFVEAGMQSRVRVMPLDVNDEVTCGS